MMGDVLVNIRRGIGDPEYKAQRAARSKYGRHYRAVVLRVAAERLLAAQVVAAQRAELEYQRRGLVKRVKDFFTR